MKLQSVTVSGATATATTLDLRDDQNAGRNVPAVPPAKSPSPPASTCRRLSYESAQTRSQTRASSRSCSAPQPPPSLPLPRTTPASSTHNTTKIVSPSKATPATAAASGVAASPGSPAAAAPQARVCGRGVVASTPPYVTYHSSPPSPSPSTVAAIPRPAAAPTVKAVRTPAALAPATPPSVQNVAAAAVPADHSAVHPHGLAHDNATNNNKDSAASASPFSCVLTNRTRTSGQTEQESNAITSDEKSACLSASPAAPPVAHVVASATTTKEKQPSYAPGAKPKSTTTEAIYAAACTPDTKPTQPSQPLRAASPTKHQHPTPAAQPPHHHAAPPLQSRRSRSASHDARGAAAYAAPASSLRSGGTGPSPFAADQLVMPRRPSPATISTHASTATAQQQQQQQLRPPQVQLARPPGLHHHHPTASSTSMAASQLPGAAATHSRLQAPSKTRLTRTASTTADTSGPRRRTPSLSTTPTPATVATSPFKRRGSSSSSMPTALRTAGAGAPLATQPHQRTPSGTFAFYTTRGGGAAVNAMDSSSPLAITAATGQTSRVHAAPQRSSSAPGLRRAGTPRGGAAAAAAAVSCDTEAAPPTSFRSSSAASRRLHTTTTAGGIGVSSKGSRASSSASATASASRELEKRRGDRSARVGTVPSAVTRRTSTGVGGGTAGARPMISAIGSIGGAATHRARPVVSSAAAAAAIAQHEVKDSPSRPSGAATRRGRADRAGTSRTTAAARQHTGNSAVNTVSAAQSSMITMEESRDFLQEFQRMNQRELALFGTLLTTVASERQNYVKEKQQQQQRRADASASTEQDGVPHPNTIKSRDLDPCIVVQSAEEVSVWTCKRESSATPRQDDDAETGEATTGQPAVEAVAPLEMNTNNIQREDEVVVLVRRSCSRAAASKTPSPSRRLDLGSHERPRSPSPRPSEPAHTDPTSHAPQQVWVDENNKNNLDSIPSADVARVTSPRPDAATSSSPSPSPAPVSPHPAHVVDTTRPTATVVGAAEDGVSSAAAKTTLQTHSKKQSGVVVKGPKSAVLQQRNVNDANTKASARKQHGAAKAAPVCFGSDAGVRQRPSTSLHSSQSRRRRQRCAPGIVAASGPSDPHKRPPHEPEQRQRSVTSYTDMRSYSRSERRTGEGDGMVREDSSDGNGNDTCSPACDVVKDAPPLAALRRAKVLAAEQAAALVQRQRERQQQQLLQQQQHGDGVVEVDAEASHASPSMFSSCGSPSGSSMGRASSALGAAVNDVAEVRMSAAQLQLLIDGSRSRQNWERYQPL